MAGSIEINPQSVRLNGYRSNSVFAIGQDVLMTYSAVSYSFTGGGHSYQYILFKVFKKINLENSVGLNCVNNSEDIIIVQDELKAKGYYSGKVNGDFSDFLVQAIKKYQKSIGMQNPDGKIDKSGATIQSFSFEPIYFVQYARDFTDRLGDHRFAYEVAFNLPNISGKYHIAYHRLPIFSDYALGYRVDDNKIKNNSALETAIKKHINGYNEFEDIFEVEITDKREKNANVKLYLRVNNSIPFTIQGGINEAPINFSWNIEKEKEVDSLQFRYKISPYEDWSPWQQENFTCYSFIREGNNQFQIECKYKYFDEADTTRPVLLDLSLKNPFISSPCESNDTSSVITFIDKGDVKRVTTKSTSSKEVVSKVYDKSVALLIGVNDYSDNSFGKLPYINNDLKKIKQSLSTLGFEINEVGASDRENIMAGIRNVLMNAGKNDRIVIYFTAHGFIDELGGNGYIACSDCIKNNPTSNCISLKEIEGMVLSANERTKNILLILDSCFSGLGAIDKSSIKVGPAVIAGEKGCHIMTAGMSTQTAKMDHSLKMSVFTYYLTDGLNSRKADYTNDGIITLTELLVYVNYHVAKYTNAEQTPVFGRLTGIGEVIF